MVLCYCHYAIVSVAPAAFAIVLLLLQLLPRLLLLPPLLLLLLIRAPAAQQTIFGATNITRGSGFALACYFLLDTT